MNAVSGYNHTARQLTLIKNTVAKDCNTDEFNLFAEIAKAKGLDPFLGQIIPMVFGKNARDQSKRKLTIIISRDGQRVIAQRCGDYRPASKPPIYEIDPSLKGPLNPQGIVSATVVLWKQDPKTSEWFEVAGQAFWEEFAPLKDEWKDDPETGKGQKTGNQTLDSSGNWCKMPRLMISKCAEMQALRAGWPEQFTGLYDEAEMDRAKAHDMAASELIEEEKTQNRLKSIAGNDAITVTWGDGYALENVPSGQFMDRAIEFINETDPATLVKWRSANTAGLQMFWARNPGDAHELKVMLEKAIARQS